MILQMKDLSGLPILRLELVISTNKQNYLN